MNVRFIGKRRSSPISSFFPRNAPLSVARVKINSLLESNLLIKSGVPKSQSLTIIFLKANKISSVVAALPARYLKMFQFPRREKGKEKEMEGKGKEGKEMKEGKERRIERKKVECSSMY